MSTLTHVHVQDAVASNSLPAGAGQFNTLESSLVSAFQRLKEQANPNPEAPFKMIITAQAKTEDLPFEEERATAQFMNRCAVRAGLQSTFMNLESFGQPDMLEALLDAADGRYSTASTPSLCIWKLYPYEWLINEQLAVALNPPYLDGHVRFLEPAWKLIFSSKAILAYLWKKHPGHANLLPAYFSADELEDHKLTHDGAHWVAKPRFGREGDGIKYVRASEHISLTAKRASEASVRNTNVEAREASEHISKLASLACLIDELILYPLALPLPCRRSHSRLLPLPCTLALTKESTRTPLLRFFLSHCIPLFTHMCGPRAD